MQTRPGGRHGRRPSPRPGRARLGAVTALLAGSLLAMALLGLPATLALPDVPAHDGGGAVPAEAGQPEATQEGQETPASAEPGAEPDTEPAAEAKVPESPDTGAVAQAGAMAAVTPDTDAVADQAQEAAVPTGPGQPAGDRTGDDPAGSGPQAEAGGVPADAATEAAKAGLSLPPGGPAPEGAPEGAPGDEPPAITPLSWAWRGAQPEDGSPQAPAAEGPDAEGEDDGEGEDGPDEPAGGWPGTARPLLDRKVMPGEIAEAAAGTLSSYDPAIVMVGSDIDGPLGWSLDREAWDPERLFMSDLGHELPPGTVPTVAYDYRELPGDAVATFNDGTYESPEALEAAAETLWAAYAETHGYWYHSPAKTAFKERVKFTHDKGMPIQFVGVEGDDPAAIAERLLEIDGPVVYVGEPEQVGFEQAGPWTRLAGLVMDLDAWGAGIPEYLTDATPSGLSLENRTSVAMPIVVDAQANPFDPRSVIRMDPDAWRDDLDSPER